MLVFLDTEFSELTNNPKLISIGLVSENGAHEFYAELSDTYSESDLSEFSVSHVMPLLNGKNAMTISQLTTELEAWIAVLNDVVILASDNSIWDWPFVEEIFKQSWPENIIKECFLLNINYIKNYDVYVDAVENAYRLGLNKHHALNDAKAHRLGWITSENFSR